MTQRRLAARLHSDERGAVTIETVLIIGAVAIPLLVFLLRFGWPRVRDYFMSGMSNLEEEANDVRSGVSNR